MTTAELTTMRTNILAALNGTLASGTLAYGLDGRNVTKIPPTQLFEMLNLIDAQISRNTNGGFFVMQSRETE